MFDLNVAKARSALHGRTDAELMAPWTLTSQGKELFTMPKASVLRTFVLNHLVHHRGQLTVYLRLHDIALPSIYGPSGDERIVNLEVELPQEASFRTAMPTRTAERGKTA